MKKELIQEFIGGNIGMCKYLRPSFECANDCDDDCDSLGICRGFDGVVVYRCEYYGYTMMCRFNSCPCLK